MPGEPIEHWDAMFDRGVRNHLLSSRCAAPRMVRRRRGLIVTTTFWDRGRYLRGNLLYDLAKTAMTRLAFGMAEELREHEVASIAVSPGWTRTEFVLAGHGTDEAHFRDQPALAHRVATLCRSRHDRAGGVRTKSGSVQRVGYLAREYGFTDVDGRQSEPFEPPE